MSMMTRANRTGGRKGYRSLAEACECLLSAFQLQRGLVRALGGWLAGVAYWDAKLAMGDHLWEHARHGSRLLSRLHELKETAAERKEAGPVGRIVDLMASAPDGDAFLVALYQVFLPRLALAYRAWAESMDPVMDPLSRRLLSEAAVAMDEQVQWFGKWRPVYSPERVIGSPAWVQTTEDLLEKFEWSTGCWADNGAQAAAAEQAREFAGFQLPLRDACFRTAYVNEVARATGEGFEEHRLKVFYNHTQEMQFAESLGAILYDTAEMPWAFHHDLARHCTDEIKHTRMGCERLASLGEDLRRFPMLLQNYALRAKLDPMERFCMMTLVIEASSFEKKRANVKLFAEHGDAISERYETYDIRDEMLHVNFGHTWVPILLRVHQDGRSVNDLVQHCRDILEDALKDERRAS